MFSFSISLSKLDLKEESFVVFFLSNLEKQNKAEGAWKVWFSRLHTCCVRNSGKWREERRWTLSSSDTKAHNFNLKEKGAKYKLVHKNDIL